MSEKSWWILDEHVQFSNSFPIYSGILGEYIQIIHIIYIYLNRTEKILLPHIVTEKVSHFTQFIATAAFANLTINKYFRQWLF